jgi:glycosyltransferase involved in cell wall biosynthesis
MKTSDSKRKIVSHVLYSGLGGHGSVFFSLVEADKKDEFDFRANFVGVEEMTKEYVNSCERLQVPFVYLQKKNGLHPGAFFKLFGLFRKQKPAAIFLHGVGFSIISAFWYKMTRPRTRIMVRDTQAHHLKTKFEWIWLFFGILLSGRIIVLTEASGQGIKKKFGWMVGKKKLVVIPNGLNMDKYQPANKEPGSNKIIIGMQSRLQPIKDHPTLIRAFEKILKDLPAHYLELHIAGAGETMPALKRLVAEAGLQRNVIFHGMLGEKELLTFMHSLDIYVHATFGETLSNSIMQAMASGLPVIASDVWGVSNMIKDNDTGFLYESGNVEQLASLMEQLIREPGKRRALGITARVNAEKEYSNQTMFKRYSELV